MIQLESAAKKWLRENGGDLFLCPHQPGNLLISRRFCSERYRSSQRLKGNGFWFDDRAIYNLRASLLKCRTCSIGKKMGEVEGEPLIGRRNEIQNPSLPLPVRNSGREMDPKRFLSKTKIGGRHGTF